MGSLCCPEKSGTHGFVKLFFVSLRCNKKLTVMLGRSFIALVFMLSLSVAAFSQVVRDGSYRSVGRIESDGTVRDASYRKIGSFDSDGSIRDASYRKIGVIEKDGTVRDGSYRKIGVIEKDGTVRDDSYRKIGVIEKDGTVRDGSYRKIGTVEGTDRNRAAVFFFFFNRFG